MKNRSTSLRFFYIIYSVNSNNETGSWLMGGERGFMPEYLKDPTNNQLIIASIGFSGDVTYESVEVDASGIHTNELFTKQVADYDEVDLFNQQQGYVDLEMYRGDDFSGIANF